LNTEVNQREALIEQRTHEVTEKNESLIKEITERKVVEEKFRKISLAVEQSSESISITNMNAEIEYVNESFLRTSGYKLEELIGQNPRILQSGKTPKKTYEHMWSTLGEGKTWKGELYNRSKGGKEYTEYSLITPLRQPDGTISHYVSIKEDITNKKIIAKELDQHRHHLEELVALRTEELLIAQKKAVAANKSKSDFLANMSHEIRTPMNGIIGMIHLALQSQQSDKQKEYINKAQYSAKNLLEIINDILDFSKIEAGKLNLEETNFQLKQVINNMLNLVQLKAEDAGINLFIKIAPDVPVLLIGDPLRLGQILINLTKNPIKFSQSDVIISLKVILEEETESEVGLHFSINDTGIGMSSEDQGKLFQSFSQADSSTTRKYGGTGLGLTISQKITALMNGKMWVDSKEGIGSTFHFTARLKKQINDLLSNASIEDHQINIDQAIAQLHGKKILLVEDNEINQELARELLLMNGITVETADNGQEALELLLNQSFDGVLMDCMMPEMDGYEATRKIRAQDALQGLPVIAMTANAMKQDVKKVLSVGMNDHISKPINPETMFITMAKWIKP